MDVSIEHRRIGIDRKLCNLREKEVVVVGSCNCDLISYMDRLPNKGETVIGTCFRMEFGGKGANQCISAADLGCKTIMVAKVGVDSFGNDYVNRFKDKSINVDKVEQVKDVPTGTAMINIENKGANTIVIIGGANDRLSSDDVDLSSECIKGHRLMVCQLEVPHSTSFKALQVAQSLNVKTLLNPTPMDSKFDKEILKFVDYLCLNESEIQQLTGLEVITVDQGKGACLKLLHESSETSSGNAPFRILLTMGSQGVVYTDYDYSVEHEKGIKVEAIDTTGAGDTFIGAMAFLLTRDDIEFPRCISLANKMAALSVTRCGAQTMDTFVDFV